MQRGQADVPLMLLMLAHCWSLLWQATATPSRRRDTLARLALPRMARALAPAASAAARLSLLCLLLGPCTPPGPRPRGAPHRPRRLTLMMIVLFLAALRHPAAASRSVPVLTIAHARECGAPAGCVATSFRPRLVSHQLKEPGASGGAKEPAADSDINIGTKSQAIMHRTPTELERELVKLESRLFPARASTSSCGPEIFDNNHNGHVHIWTPERNYPDFISLVSLIQSCASFSGASSPRFELRRL